MSLVPPSPASRSYLINVFSCVVCRLLQMSVLVWVNQYLLKRISTEEYSLYPLVLSIVLFGDLFKSLFTGGLARFLVSAHARGDKVEITRITSSMFPVLLSVGLVILGAAVMASWRIEVFIEVDSVYAGQARTMLLILAGVMCVNVATTPFQLGLYVQQKFFHMNLIELASEILRITVLLTLLTAVSSKVIWLVVASATGSLVSMSLMIVMGRRRMSELHFDRKLACVKQVKILLSFSVWVGTEMFSSVAARSLPLLFLNRFSSSVGVTCYHLANLVDYQVKQLLAAAMRPAQPALTALHATGRKDILKQLYYRGGRYQLWVILLPAGPFVCFGSDLMGRYAGDEFRDAGYVLLAFFLRYPFIYASSMYYRLAHAAAKIRTYYICDVILQVVIILSMYGVLRYHGGGAVQAAWCACIAQSVMQVLVIWPLGMRFIDGRWLDFFTKTLLPGYLPFAVSIVISLGLKSVLVANNWITLIGVFAAGTLANLVTIGIVGFYTDDQLAFQSLRNRVRRGVAVIDSVS